jgi:hypothetical protein
MKKFPNSDLVGCFYDNYLGKNYDLVRATASEVSAYLKANLKAKGIDHERFNMHRDMDDEIENPPVEIYEYQNFFLMERTDGERILLDGFRRLLYCTPPKHIVNIRIYKESEMSKEDIMKMMVYLNHFKFYGISDYYDRGFALTMYLLFGIDIPKFKVLFDAYLTQYDGGSFYNDVDSKEGYDAKVDVAELMTQPLFIDNMKFLSDMKGTGQMTNQFFVFQFRKFIEQYQKPLTADEFLSKVKGNKLLDELLVKYKKVGTHNSSDSTKIVRQITQIYEKVFNDLLGVETPKTYAELVEEMKGHVERLKKDKSLLKLTKKSNYRYILERMLRMVRTGQKLEFIMVVHPYDNLTWDRGKTKTLPLAPGVYDNIVPSIGSSGHLSSKGDTVVINVMEGDKVRATSEIYWGYGLSSTTKVFTEVQADYSYFKKTGIPNMKCDVFVRMKEEDLDGWEPITAAELKEMSDKPAELLKLRHFGWEGKEPREDIMGVTKVQYTTQRDEPMIYYELKGGGCGRMVGKIKPDDKLFKLGQPGSTFKNALLKKIDNGNEQKNSTQKGGKEKGKKG